MITVPEPSDVGDSSAGQRYLANAHALLARLSAEQWPHIHHAAASIASAFADGRSLHVFGSGHSHMIAEELYYRAGGLVSVKPILFDGLMLHGSTRLSTSLERLPGLATALLADHPLDRGDVIIIVSNSGGNAVSLEMAREAHRAGATVIAITSLEHATSSLARHSDEPRLHTISDIVIDNCGCVGDAAIEVGGMANRVGPTSTVVVAAIVNAMVTEVAELLVSKGIAPQVYESLNTTGGDAASIERA